MSLRGVQGVLLALLIMVVWPIEAQLSDLVFCFAKSSGPCNATTPCKKKKEICVNTLAGEICCKSNKVKASPTTTTTTTTETPPDPGQANDQNQPNQPPDPVDPDQSDGQNQQDGSNQQANCEDKKNPKTGQSDCPRMVSYCNVREYYDLMTQQCPKTCNRCNDANGQSSGGQDCRDLGNPFTGSSDCPKLIAYCQHSLYIELMKQQCPKTCKFCL